MISVTHPLEEKRKGYRSRRLKGNHWFHDDNYYMSQLSANTSLNHNIALFGSILVISLVALSQCEYSNGPSAYYNVHSSSLYIQTEILLDLIFQ